MQPDTPADPLDEAIRAGIAAAVDHYGVGELWEDDQADVEMAAAAAVRAAAPIFAARARVDAAAIEAERDRARKDLELNKAGWAAEIENFQRAEDENADLRSRLATAERVVEAAQHLCSHGPRGLLSEVTPEEWAWERDARWAALHKALRERAKGADGR